MSLRTKKSRSRGPSLLAVVWEFLPAFLLCLLFAAVGVMHASSRLAVVRQGYEMSRLEQENRNLAREEDQLKLELATLKNPSRLERLAREKWNMAPPSGAAVLTLKSSPPPQASPKSATATAEATSPSSPSALRSPVSNGGRP